MIRGRNITIRPIEVDDQPFIHELNADPGVRGRVVGWDWPASLKAQQDWFHGAMPTSTHRWVVCSADGARIGLTGLWDVNWHDRNALTALKLGGREPTRGRGFGIDAIMTVMAFAFYDVGLHRLHGAILADNAPSIRAYVEKCGWTIEGRARQHVWRHGRYMDLLTVGILKEDFDGLAAAPEYRDRIIGNDS